MDRKPLVNLQSMGVAGAGPTERLNSNSPVLHSRTLLFLCTTVCIYSPQTFKPSLPSPPP